MRCAPLCGAREGDIAWPCKRNPRMQKPRRLSNMWRVVPLRLTGDEGYVRFRADSRLVTRILGVGPSEIVKSSGSGRELKPYQMNRLK